MSKPRLPRAFPSKTAAGLVILVGAIGAEPAQSAPTPAELYAHPGQLVPVSSGRRLNLWCIGQGAPTVVLEAGGANPGMVWGAVHAKIAAFTRVCAYDRAGYGFSDANDRPSTAQNIVDDLHQALDKAGIRPPLVLVGHSAGGLYQTLYADQHLSEVAGMVLIDPSFAGGDRQTSAFATPEERTKQQAAIDNYRGLMRDCADAARAGNKAALAAKGCPCGAPNPPPVLAQAVADYCVKPVAYESVLAESLAFQGKIGELSESEKEEEAAARPFGALPLIVLTNAVGVTSTSPDTNAKATMVWRAGHVALSARSTRGQVRVVANAKHMIQIEQPQAVVDAVREVVTAARGQR